MYVPAFTVYVVSPLTILPMGMLPDMIIMLPLAVPIGPELTDVLFDWLLPELRGCFLPCIENFLLL